MTTTDIKTKILEANSAYRSGNAIISDIEFDGLVEEYQKLSSKDEYEAFRNSLHEVSGKIKHPYVMGSLDKLKYEEPDTILDFLKTPIKNNLSISAKVDGISCRLNYHEGKLISGTTRGDGEFGVGINDKIQYIKYIPQTIEYTDDIDIRGELVILKSDFEQYFSDKFANGRNCCAGLINRKMFNVDDISKISFIPYTILGDKFTKKEQFELLTKLGFKVAWNITVDNIEYKTILEKLFNDASQDFEYETDGLVISDIGYRNEDKYRPDNQKAFKINNVSAITTIIDIDWGSPSKDGRLCPVAILAPIEIQGSVISKVTLNNIDYIKNMDLKIGCEVEIIKSGMVIPKIIKKVSDKYATI